MKKLEKIDYLQENHLREWVKTRAKVEQELSDAHDIFCECGHLATGGHESGCHKFKNKIMNETIKRLSYLLPDERKSNA